MIIKVGFRLVCVAMPMPGHFAKFVDYVVSILFMGSLVGIIIFY